GGVAIETPNPVVTIHDGNAFDIWRWEHFPDDPEGAGAPNADPDGDTMPNFMEFTFYLDPARPDREHFVSMMRPVLNSSDAFLWVPATHRWDSSHRIRVLPQLAVDDALQDWQRPATQNIPYGWEKHFLGVEIPDDLLGIYLRIQVEYHED